MANGDISELLYPHDDLIRLRGSEQSEASFAYEAVHLARFLGLQTMHIEDFEARSWAFRIANGNPGSDILPSKQRFSEAVNELGYHAPRSVSIDVAGSPDVTVKQTVLELDDRPERFCKPANSARGRGTHVAPTPEAALEFVATQSEDYLIQSLEKPVHDWRYIYHRDADQLSDRAPGAWRVLFKVARPTIEGDGERGIADLVARSEDIPARAKQNYLSRHAETNDVLPAGTFMELVHTGNRAGGAYRIPHSLSEERNLDRFLSGFISDMEAALGTTLATVCVDLGTFSEDTLEDSYDEERLKRDVVFYEHQLPFGMWPYLQEMLPASTRWNSRDKLVPTAYRRRYVESQVYAAFVRSVIRSGRLLRK